jgi:hypothetical protein
VAKKKSRVKRTVKRKSKSLKSDFKSKTKKFKGKKLKSIRSKKRKPRVDPMWDLERDGITYSMISQFLGCRHRFHVANVQGWKPRKISFPLEFGNIFHLMDEAVDKGIDIELMPKLATNYVTVRSQESVDPQELQELSMMAAICAVTFKQYKKFWTEHWSLEQSGKRYYSDKFHWIEKEAPFDQNYRMPNGRVVKLRGKRDGAFQLARGSTGNWLFETKTKGDIDEQGLSQGLHKDMQTGLYLLSMQLQYGKCPSGLIYNVIRRTRLKPREGRVLKSGERQGKDSPASFAARVEEDIIKRPEFYFHRWSRPIVPLELQEFQQRQLDPILFQICTWWDSIKRNPMSPFETKCLVCEGGGKVFGIWGGGG